MIHELAEGAWREVLRSLDVLRRTPLGEPSQIRAVRLERTRRSSLLQPQVLLELLQLEGPGYTVRDRQLAFGSVSCLVMGATSFGYDLARQFGLKIVPPRPALVPLAFSGRDREAWCDLAGVAIDVIASTRRATRNKNHSTKAAFRENMLFTHRGISGPAILQISSYWDGKAPISIDLAPGRDLAAEFLAHDNRDPLSWKTLLREVLPRRFADRWLEVHPLTGNSNRVIAQAEQQVHHWEVSPEETEGYGKAEVTAGGVDTNELSAQTMEARKVPGLFFIGEVVDVTGQLGGYNFQWAWASGFCAGQAV